MTRDAVKEQTRHLTPDELARITWVQVMTIADEILTPKQLAAFRLHAAGHGYGLIAETLQIDKSTARDRIQASLTKIRIHIGSV